MPEQADRCCTKRRDWPFHHGTATRLSRIPAAMTGGPIDLIWAAHAIALSRDIEAPMTARAAEGFRPLVVMLQLPRLEAAKAVVALCEVDPTRPEDIRALQNQVNR